MNCSFHLKNKDEKAIVYGDVELFEKKKITNFLLNHDIQFEASDPKNNVYEAVIKVRDLSPAMKKALLKDKHTMKGIETMMQLMGQDPISTERSKRSKDSKESLRDPKIVIYNTGSYKDLTASNSARDMSDRGQAYESFSFVKDQGPAPTQNGNSQSSLKRIESSKSGGSGRALDDICPENLTSLNYYKALNLKRIEEENPDFMRSYESKRIVERLPTELFEMITGSGKKVQVESEADFSFLKMGKDYIEKSLSSNDHRLEYESAGYFGVSPPGKEKQLEEVALKNAEFLNRIVLKYDENRQQEQPSSGNLLIIDQENNEDDHEFRKQLQKLRKINDSLTQQTEPPIEKKSFLSQAKRVGFIPPTESPAEPNPSHNSVRRSQEEIKVFKEIPQNIPPPKPSNIASDDPSRKVSGLPTPDETWQHKEENIEDEGGRSTRREKGKTSPRHKSGSSSAKRKNQSEEPKSPRQITPEELTAMQLLLRRIFPNISFAKIIKFLASDDSKLFNYKRIGDLEKSQESSNTQSQENFLTDFLKKQAKKLFEELEFDSIKRLGSPEKDHERWRSPGASARTFDSYPQQNSKQEVKLALVETFDARAHQGYTSSPGQPRSKTPANSTRTLRDPSKKKISPSPSAKIDNELESDEGWVRIKSLEKQNRETKKKIDQIFHYGQKTHASRKFKQLEEKFADKMKSIKSPRSPTPKSPRDPQRLGTITERSQPTERSIPTERSQLSERSKTPEREFEKQNEKQNEPLDKFGAEAWKINSQNFGILAKKKQIYKKYSDVSKASLDKAVKYHNKKEYKLEKALSPKKKAPPKIEELSSRDILKLQQTKVDRAKVLQVDYIRKSLKENTTRHSRSRSKESKDSKELFTTELAENDEFLENGRPV